MRSTASPKHLAFVFAGLIALIAQTGCSSAPPPLPQVTCCIEKPINTDEWVARKTKQHEERLRKRQEMRELLVATPQNVQDAEDIQRQLEESDEFLKAHEEAKELVDAAKEATPAKPQEVEHIVSVAPPSKAPKSNPKTKQGQKP